MKVSQDWLKQYVDFKLSPPRFAEGLTMLGLEVESYEDLSAKYDKFVVGEVVERANHPNADRLTLCRVNVGKEILDIVCGAPNVAAGQKVAVALVGATIPRNQHDPEGNPFVLERAKIRGVTSNGMICSAFELGLGDDAEGIVVLDGNAKVGIPLAQHVHRTDVVYEIGITPNRGDCLSHIGVAREVALLVNKQVKQPKIAVNETGEKASKLATVRILDKERCPRYSARVLRNVKIQPSPQWLQDVLMAVGVRPINVVVDVTNYVMLETGQPLHAFDYDKLARHTIVVKTARSGETFVTLDGKKRTLTDDVLMICDAEKPVAIAGVMGGENSEISESTKTILIESACFDAQNVRRTSKFLGLSTEASYRFERGVDRENTVRSADRAAQMIQQLSSAEVLRGALDVYPGKRKPEEIRLRVSRTNDVLGTSLTKSQVSAFLKKIGATVRPSSADEVKAVPPSFRSDLSQEIDLIEEVARVYGYDKVEVKTRAAIDFSRPFEIDRVGDELRSWLVGGGFNEILAISLQDEKTVSLEGRQAVRIRNPVSVEMQALRTNLISGALHVVKHNRHHGTKELRLFEIGNVFSLEEGGNPGLPDSYGQEERLLLVLHGNHSPLAYGVDRRKFDFLDIKGEAARLLSKFCLDKYRFIYYDTHSALTDLTIGVEIKGTYAGFLGTIKSEVLKSFDIEEDVFVCELSVKRLRESWVRDRKLLPLPRFPGVSRDLAFVVDEAMQQLKVEDTIRSAGQPLLKSVSLFDVYVGEQTGTGKKSLAYALEFQSDDHTLRDDEIDTVISRIIQNVQQRCNAVVRG